MKTPFLFLFCYKEKRNTLKAPRGWYQVNVLFFKNMKLRSFLVLYQLVVECFGYLEWMHTRANLFHVTFLLPYFVFFLPWMIHGQQLGPLNPFFQSYFQDKALIHQYPIIALFLSSPQSSYWLIQVYQMPGLGSRISRDGFSGYSLYNLRCIFVMIFFFFNFHQLQKDSFFSADLAFLPTEEFLFFLSTGDLYIGGTKHRMMSFWPPLWQNICSRLYVNFCVMLHYHQPYVFLTGECVYNIADHSHMGLINYPYWQENVFIYL